MIRIRDVVAVAGIVLAFMAVADWRQRHPGPPGWLKNDLNDHLGAEYNEIALAIRSGRGFSDPFRVPSGATAWMPPVLPYFMAGLYWITGDDRGGVVEIIISLKAWVVMLTGLIVIYQARRLGRVWLGYAVLALGLSANFYALFQRTHDVWLLLLVVDLIWLGILRFWTPPQSAVKAACWGAFGGFAALCGPIAGGSWAVLTTVRWFPRSASQPSAEEKTVLARSKPLAIAGLCSILVITPWTIRNRLVLGKWIPIKSNVLYESWQSQCVDDDGVLDVATFARHPWGSAGEQRRRYVEVGELRFIAEKGAELRASIVERPWALPQGVANRWFAACVNYMPTGPRDEQRVWPMRFKRTVFVLPLISLMIVLALRPSPLESAIVAAICLYALYLVPYILISYYDRYAVPLLGIKMLLVLYGLDTLLRRIIGKGGWGRAQRAPS